MHEYSGKVITFKSDVTAQYGHTHLGPYHAIVIDSEIKMLTDNTWHA
jgi:hypothetical protein